MSAPEISGSSDESPPTTNTTTSTTITSSQPPQNEKKSNKKHGGVGGVKSRHHFNQQKQHGAGGSSGVGGGGGVTSTKKTGLTDLREYLNNIRSDVHKQNMNLNENNDAATSSSSSIVAKSKSTRLFSGDAVASTRDLHDLQNPSQIKIEFTIATGEHIYTVDPTIKLTPITQFDFTNHKSGNSVPFRGGNNWYRRGGRSGGVGGGGGYKYRKNSSSNTLEEDGEKMNEENINVETKEGNTIEEQKNNEGNSPKGRNNFRGRVLRGGHRFFRGRGRGNFYNKGERRDKNEEQETVARETDGEKLLCNVDVKETIEQIKDSIETIAISKEEEEIKENS